MTNYLSEVLPQIYIECNHTGVLVDNKKFRDEHSRKGETRLERKIRQAKENSQGGMTPFFKHNHPRVGAFEIMMRPYVALLSFCLALAISLSLLI